MLIAIIVIAGLAILILGHEAGHFFVAKLFGMKIDEFGFGFPPRIKAIKKGETEYSFNWLPFGGFVKISGEEEQITNPEKLYALPAEEKKRYFLFQPAWKRFFVIASGVLVNFIIGWLAISFVLMIGTPPLIIINGVQIGSPAEKAGIATGDIIKNYSSSGNFKNFIDENRGRQTTFEIIRGGKDLKFTAVPRVSTGPNEGALGVEFSQAGIERQKFFPALISGFKESILISQATVSAFYELFKNLIVHGSLMAGVVGPVGIFSVAEKTGQIGLVYLLQLIGLISLNLAVLNLIPFPALDGGRLFLIILEKVKGSPVSIKTQSLINGVGFALLLFLMAIITVRDVVNLF
ncbi:MAG: M50 family metallopeptidase [Candidatus Liptonbacteria bacterium]|nr:M50 family metallopeptidase [Candidatus Liptonbacteria bacterium]